MDYNETVNKVMVLLKEKEVCLSSRKSHKDCYETLGLYIKQKGVGYSDAVREEWFSDMKNELPRQRLAVWIQYVYQLEEMDATGKISDRRLYLNVSNYDKLTAPWKQDLDVYLDDCSCRYTVRTADLTRIYCSSGLLYLEDMGAHCIADITYDVILKLMVAKMYCTDDTRTLILNNTARMVRFYSNKGLCPESYSLVFNCQVYPHIGSIPDFSVENQKCLDDVRETVMSADEFYQSVPVFIRLLESHGYVGTTVKLARHSLTALYLFLDIHSLGFHQDIMWIWFAEIRKTMESSWLHWRRVLKFYEDYIQSGDIHPDGKYKYAPTMFDELPAWCREAISGLLDQKRREFRDEGTIKSYRCSCTRFCRFLIGHGYENFSQLSPAVIKEFATHDEHASFQGRAGCFVAVRAFLRHLDEKGYTGMHGLDKCLMPGSAPNDKIIDVLSDEQIQRIHLFRTGNKYHSPTELRDIAIVLLGLKMGLRACDILALRFQDIDWKKRQISIVMKKTKTQITLPMPVDTGNAIYLYITTGRPKAATDYIFVRSKAPYGKLTGKICTKALYRILPERKDVKGGGFHVTRRTFATNLLRNHAGIDEVMDALGHRDPTSVMQYLLLDDERSRKCGLSLGCVGISPEGGLA
ncbi:MAG: tyrosine-type recombinase/integrase [Clostridiales bacterium]|nr:tyrosine-type recombinase/integrase [Clostridiales bacterium]